MRVRWRGLELPTRVEPDKIVGDTYGRFVVEPFERGLGTTVGNSLRRILLSTIEGAAVTKVRIKGAAHEFSTLEGVQEDVTDVILNIKNLVVAMEDEGPRTMTLEAQGPGQVTGELIEADPSVRVVNPELPLATLTAEVDFDVEFTVEKGRGYVPASELQEADRDAPIGTIHVDAIFSPVLRVRYSVEDTRVGQKTNYDRLTLEIWTNGAVRPEMAMVEAAKILRKHLNPFIQYGEIGEQTVAEPPAQPSGIDEEQARQLQLPISELDLSVRASNCLESENINTIGDLVRMKEDQLLSIRALGRTSLREIKRKLNERGLDLGMEIPGGQEVSASE